MVLTGGRSAGQYPCNYGVPLHDCQHDSPPTPTGALVRPGRSPGRRRGRGKGRLLVLASASIDLLKQSSESHAGRIRYPELAPLDAGEVGRDRLDALWLCGGFPESLLAGSDPASMRWRVDFIRTYLERDVPHLGRCRDRPAAEATRPPPPLGHRDQARARAQDRAGLSPGLRVRATGASPGRVRRRRAVPARRRGGSGLARRSVRGTAGGMSRFTQCRSVAGAPNALSIEQPVPKPGIGRPSCEGR